MTRLEFNFSFIDLYFLLLEINGQYIKSSEILLRSLCIEELTKSTGVYLKEKVEEALKSFNITPSQVYTCTTDNGSNMLNF